MITRPKHQKFSYATAGQNTNCAIPLYVNNRLVHLRGRTAQSIQWLAIRQRTALFWVVTQQVVVSAVLSYSAAEGWNHAWQSDWLIGFNFQGRQKYFPLQPQVWWPGTQPHSYLLHTWWQYLLSQIKQPDSDSTCISILAHNMQNPVFTHAICRLVLLSTISLYQALEDAHYACHCIPL